MTHTRGLGRMLIPAILFSITLCIADAQTSQMALGYRRTLNTDWIGYNGQNMIRDSLGWPNPYLMKNLPPLLPKNLRYPGGGLANFWNWHIGWFVNSPLLPPAYQGMQQLPNTL